MGTTDGSDLLPGTLDLLILKTLADGAQHGYGIARHLQSVSDDVLQESACPLGVGTRLLATGTPSVSS